MAGHYVRQTAGCPVGRESFPEKLIPDFHADNRKRTVLLWNEFPVCCGKNSFLSVL